MLNLSVLLTTILNLNFDDSFLYNATAHEQDYFICDGYQFEIFCLSPQSNKENKIVLMLRIRFSLPKLFDNYVMIYLTLQLDSNTITDYGLFFRYLDRLHI